MTSVTTRSLNHVEPMQKFLEAISFQYRDLPEELNHDNKKKILFYGNNIHQACEDIVKTHNSTLEKAFQGIVWGLFLQDNEGFDFEMARRSAIEDYLREQKIFVN